MSDDSIALLETDYFELVMCTTYTRIQNLSCIYLGVRSVSIEMRYSALAKCTDSDLFDIYNNFEINLHTEAVLNQK